MAMTRVSAEVAHKVLARGYPTQQVRRDFDLRTQCMVYWVQVAEEIVMEGGVEECDEGGVACTG